MALVPTPLHDSERSGLIQMDGSWCFHKWVQLGKHPTGLPVVLTILGPDLDAMWWFLTLTVQDLGFVGVGWPTLCTGPWITNDKQPGCLKTWNMMRQTNVNKLSRKLPRPNNNKIRLFLEEFPDPKLLLLRFLWQHYYSQPGTTS